VRSSFRRSSRATSSPSFLSDTSSHLEPRKAQTITRNSSSYESGDLLTSFALGNRLRLSNSKTACSPHKRAPSMIAPAARSQSRTEHGGSTGFIIGAA
jgi:hypothetical protein